MFQWEEKAQEWDSHKNVNNYESNHKLETESDAEDDSWNIPESSFTAGRVRSHTDQNELSSTLIDIHVTDILSRLLSTSETKSKSIPALEISSSAASFPSTASTSPIAAQLPSSDISTISKAISWNIQKGHQTSAFVLYNLSEIAKRTLILGNIFAADWFGGFRFSLCHSSELTVLKLMREIGVDLCAYDVASLNVIRALDGPALDDFSYARRPESFYKSLLSSSEDIRLGVESISEYHRLRSYGVEDANLVITFQPFSPNVYPPRLFDSGDVEQQLEHVIATVESFPPAVNKISLPPYLHKSTHIILERLPSITSVDLQSIDNSYLSDSEELTATIIPLLQSAHLQRAKCGNPVSFSAEIGPGVMKVSEEIAVRIISVIKKPAHDISCTDCVNSDDTGGDLKNNSTTTQHVFVDDGLYGVLRGCGSSDNMTITEVRPDPSTPFRRIPTVVWGPTCDGLDKLASCVHLADDLKVGDWLVFNGVFTGGGGGTHFNGMDNAERKAVAVGFF